MINNVLITVFVVYGGMFLVLLMCFVYAFLNLRTITKADKEVLKNAGEVLVGTNASDVHNASKNDIKSSTSNLPPTNVQTDIDKSSSLEKVSLTTKVLKKTKRRNNKIKKQNNKTERQDNVVSSHG